MHLSNLNLQVDQDFLASHNSSIVWTLVVSYAEVNVRVKDGGKKNEWIGEALQNIKLVDTFIECKILLGFLKTESSPPAGIPFL